MNKSTQLISFLCLVLTTSVSLILFWLFQPIPYVDNFNSYLICNNSNQYQAGSNFVFSVNGKLDKFNDIKARKLCDHGIILDYANAYSINPNKNYLYKPAKRVDSNWLQAILLATIPVFLVLSIAKDFKYKVALLALSFTISLIFFFFFLKSSTDDLFCQRNAALQSEDFKKSVNKAGRLLHELDEKYMLKVKEQIYKNCLHE